MDHVLHASDLKIEYQESKICQKPLLGECQIQTDHFTYSFCENKEDRQK
jgi:hypothetical protein